MSATTTQPSDPLAGPPASAAVDAGRHRPGEPGGARRSTGDRIRWLARGLGQTLITAGLVILLFVVYEVWVTNLFAAQQQSQVHQQLTQAWAAGKNPETGAATRVGLPGAAQSTIPAGVGIANLYIPRFGKDYAFTIVEGVNDADLEKGPGHYSDTALPGQKGNFSVAGHRVGKGEPFLNLDQLQPGDPVVVQTKNTWFVYHVLGQGGDMQAKDANGVPGQEVVYPSDVNVIAPTPDHAGSPATGSYMTMTTCTPKYSATQRLIVHATLVAAKPASGNALPTELGGTL